MRVVVGERAARGLARRRERDRLVNEGVIGRGVQAGPLLPEWGPSWADVRCYVCDAGWADCVDEEGLGGPCPWCERRHQAIIVEQAELVLRPPEIERDDIGWPGAMKAWRDRLRRAVEVGLIANDEAERAWRRANDRRVA
jgi:hypothetical protein